MKIDQDVTNKIGQRIVENGVQCRHRTRERQLYETVYRVPPSPEASREDVELILSRVVQARANQLSERDYKDLVGRIDPVEILGFDKHSDAFEALRAEDGIGQKIANEFLRHAVDVFGFNHQWRDDLHVALDTNVVQALVKTEAIKESDGISPDDRSAQEIVNMDPQSDPRIKVAYSEVQEAFREAAEPINYPPIIFDELWLEHRTFISDPLLRDRSILYEMLDSDLR